MAEVWDQLKGIPQILGFRISDSIAEIMMTDCGMSLYKFTKHSEFRRMSGYHRSCVAFDMFRQILLPLKLLHKKSYVHGDIKGDNVCVRKRNPNAPRQKIKRGQPYESEYEFTLIDFGVISKFKLKKVPRTYDTVVGNLMFATLRQLNCQQTRFQDDIESLLFLVYQLIFGTLPWDE